MWKVIDTSNFDLETVADELICENIPDKANAQKIANEHNTGRGDGSYMWAIVVPQSRRLSRGMEDLI